MNSINTTMWGCDATEIWGMLPLVSIFSLLSRKKYDEYEITEKEAEGILRYRFVNGEISCEEYTKRMARL